MSLRLLGGAEENVSMESLESEDERTLEDEKKRKLEGKSTRPSEDAMYLRKEIIDAIKRTSEKIETCSQKADEKMETYDEQMESFSKKTDENMDTFLQKSSGAVGLQLQGMNPSIAKMKEEEDNDRYNQINERIANMEKKISDIGDKYENRNEETRGTHVDWNQGTAVATGFRSETSELEVEQLLKETITEMGMSIENARIECSAKPITHAFIYYKNDDEMNEYVRSANMLKKELKGRKIKMTRSVDATFHQQRMGYVKCCIHTRHNIPFNSTSFNWYSKYVSAKGPDCGKNMPEYQGRSNRKMAIKKLIATIVSSRVTGQRRRNEGKTTSSQMHMTPQENHGKDRHTSEGGGRRKLKQVDGNFSSILEAREPQQENKMKRDENLKGKGGGRLKHCNVDGDVPLCLRNFDEENKDSSSINKNDKRGRAEAAF